MTSDARLPSPQATSRAGNTSILLRLLPLVLLMGGFALRLYRLGTESLWYDETVSVYLASQSLGDLIAHTARDIHPPAYYALLHFWRLIASPTVAFGLEFLYAWPSLSLDMLVVALTFTVARRAFGIGAALWALALASIHPTQLWMAQEVRMYALGAFCLMLTLWSVLPLFTGTRSTPNAALSTSRAFAYVIAALLGLYTLYYFLFWLAVLNLCIIFARWQTRTALRQWIILQLIVLLGWLPWLPTFLRQSLTPPVPPWRVPWQNPAEFLTAVQEALAAIWTGHTFPYSMTLPWAAIVIALAVSFIVYTKHLSRQHRILWLTLAFAPTLLLLIVSVIGPPLYHVRYVATYAPLFVLLVGATLASAPRTLQVPSFLILALISGVALQELWTNPRYAADDHRQAVATLADAWRPGDAILVNAGWAYTILEVYWPDALPSPLAARPPSLAATMRLNQLVRLDQVASADTATFDSPVVYRTGSVNGSPQLGWGLPEGDFFAISEQATDEALSALAARYARLWHYRIYDTVSDPDGYIRQWLNAHTTQEFTQPIPGRDFARLEAYRTGTSAPLPEPAVDNIIFPDAAMGLTAHSAPASLPAGEYLYVNLLWEHTGAAQRVEPAASLRLYDSSGTMIVQSDLTLPSIEQGQQIQSFALPIPAATPPGEYTLALVLYATDDLQPIAALSSTNDLLPTPLALDSIAVEPPNPILLQ